MTPLPEVRLALGLRSTAQSLGVIGHDAGVFREQGLDLVIAREETAGPDGVRGLVAGEYDLAEFGAVPLVQAVYEGHDPVVLLAAEQTNAMYLLGAARIDAPRALVGEKIGVLSIAGQTGVSAATMLDRWTLRREDVELLELGTYPAIYQALQDGRIAAGVLTADYGVAGSVAFGLHRLADLGQELRFQGPIVATTRRYARAHPDRVQRAVTAYVRTIELFADHPDRVLESMKRHLGFLDHAQALAVHDFYSRRFQRRPHPSEAGLQRVIDLYAATSSRPALRLEDVWDRSFLDRSLQA
ncbi:ABC transporter substrate-binding protein [Pigmentiphaga sp.]|uniref:ABC transporter substrate-binding protein n=1 Tax=Pigmentiphaga sp. TaxID=1977564 RepID=UPI0025E7AC5B|nr:ABC transporter substrate-binding protein [Pigmentiphaga sp.]